MLTFAPLAWLKLRLFLHADNVEVGFFGISDPNNLLYVTDLAVLKQTVSLASVAFDDDAVADHFDQCADAGISPARCGRIWVHTHPGNSPAPSFTDEETSARVFGNCDWSIMAIVARNGSTFARLTFSSGPGGSVEIPVHVDWERFAEDLAKLEGSLDDLVTTWMNQYGENVFPEIIQTKINSELPVGVTRGLSFDEPDEMDELYERQWAEDEMAVAADADDLREGDHPWR